MNKVEIRSQVNELLTDDAFLQADSKRRDGGCQVFNTQPFFFLHRHAQKSSFRIGDVITEAERKQFWRKTPL